MADVHREHVSLQQQEVPTADTSDPDEAVTRNDGPADLQASLRRAIAAHGAKDPMDAHFIPQYGSLRMLEEHLDKLADSRGATFTDYQSCYLEIRDQYIYRVSLALDQYADLVEPLLAGAENGPELTQPLRRDGLIRVHSARAGERSATVAVTEVNSPAVATLESQAREAGRMILQRTRDAGYVTDSNP